MSRTDNKNIRIIDIARMAGVSAGTVDRVIHNRGRVSHANKAKVEKVLSDIGYAPNLAARALASKREYPIAVIAPSYEGESYWGMVSEGIIKATEELRQYNISVDFIRFDQYDRNTFPESIKQLAKEYKGVVIATLFEKRVKKLSAELDHAGIPYVYIDSDIEGQDDLAYFGVDSFRSGYIAAKLLLREIGNTGNILIVHIKFRPEEISVQMRAREIGFIRYLRDAGYNGRRDYLVIDPAKESNAVWELEKYLRTKEEKTGILVLNSRVYELASLMHLIAPALRKKTVLAGFEAIQPNAQALESGELDFLISQRPELQGYNAVKALGNFFITGQRPEKVNYMPIDILFKENIDYYKNHKL